MTYPGGQLDASSAKRLYRTGEALLDTHNMYLKAYVETGIQRLGCLLLLATPMPLGA